MAYLGWIIAAFLGGLLLSGVFSKPSSSLRRRFAAIDRYRGLSSAQVIAAVRVDPHTIIHQADGHTLMIWQEQRYSMSLLFDENDVCLGVEEEKECML